MAIYELYLDEKGRVQNDLYVRLPTLDRYVCYIKSGDEIAEEKITTLYTHVDPHIYLRVEKLNASNDNHRTGIESTSATSAIDIMRFSGEKNEVKINDLKKFSEPIAEKIFQIFSNLKDPAQLNLEANSEAINSLAGEILDLVAPEALSLQEALLHQAKNIDLMKNSSAILCLAVLIAAHNDFSARNIFKDLAFATLLMDMTLTDIPNEKLEANYLKDPGLDPAVINLIQSHPLDAFTLVNTKLSTINDSIRQMILGHHELYNGKGYPRGIRSESLPPIVRILSLAVDTFEIMKTGLIKNESISIANALHILHETHAEPHLRRHGRKLVENSIQGLVRLTSQV